MFKIKNLSDNDNIVSLETMGPFQTFEYKKDMSVNPYTAQNEWFNAEMNVRKRQVLCRVNDDLPIITQAGAMQWTIGQVECTTGVKGVGDFAKKMVGASVSKETTIKPEYRGKGFLMLEPTYKYLVLLNVNDWGKVVLDDGLFLACTGDVVQKITRRRTVSSAFSSEGLFNLCLSSKGDNAYAVLESNTPKSELIEIELQNDVIKIDGNLAIAWSDTLDFTVERSSKSLIGSMTNGEGLVNVYRGSGRILMAPVASNNMSNQELMAMMMAKKQNG